MTFPDKDSESTPATGPFAHPAEGQAGVREARDRLEDALRGNLQPIVEWAALFAGCRPALPEEAAVFDRFRDRRDNALDAILAVLASTPEAQPGLPSPIATGMFDRCPTNTPPARDRDAIARAVLDGWYSGNVDWDYAPPHWKDSAFHAADAIIALDAPATEQPASQQAADGER